MGKGDDAKSKDEGGNGDRGQVTGVVKLRGQSQLPQEFITSGKTFIDALGKTVFRDPNQATSVILYYAQLKLFNMDSEIEDLTNFLNAQNAIGGINKSLAAMTHTGIYLPEGAGIKMSKDDRKQLSELQKMKLQGHKGKEETETY